MIDQAILTASAGLSTLGSLAAGISYAAFKTNCQWFGPVLYRCKPTLIKRVALTFDDGPSQHSTEKVLDLLNAYDIPATFFIIGRNAAHAPSLVQLVHESGHLLANHSFDHARLGAFKPRTYWIDQIKRTNDVIHQAVGVRPRLFRPPMGIKTPRQLYAARHLDMLTVTWTHRGYDTCEKSSDKVVSRLTKNLTPGSILLLHDGAEPGRPRDGRVVLQALPKVIESIQQAGMTFVRLDDALQEAPYLHSS